ncbi:muscular LMNA-interacting protein isoform 8-T8 [Sarcophilus harrisii]
MQQQINLTGYQKEMIAGILSKGELVFSGDSETKPLIFTFVPTIRRLPTQSQVSDASKYLVKIGEEPRDKDPGTSNSNKFSDHLTFKSGIRQESDIQTYACSTETSQKIFQEKGLKLNQPETMQQSDLFKAEYVFIVDSEGEEEAIGRKEEKQLPVGNGHGLARPKTLPIAPGPVIALQKSHHGDFQVPGRSELPQDAANPQKQIQYKIKSNYKAFAAIPTNTILLEQKALDEPAKSERITKDSTLDSHLEANLTSPSSTVAMSQLTKPGVIRPVSIKSKILLRKEEEDTYEPNPFSKYLEENSGLFAGQDTTSLHDTAPLHPVCKTKPFLPAKSLLHPQSLSYTDCLIPGPFSHLSSISLGDRHMNSPTSFNHNGLYNKPSHPIVTIPENEALGFKEMRKWEAQRSLRARETVLCRT